MNPINETQFRFSDRLAQISRRQMQRVTGAAADEDDQDDDEEEEPMEATEGRNGVKTRKGTRTRYTDEFKAETLKKFAAAESKKDFAREVGLHRGMLGRWRAEAKAEKPTEKPARQKPGPKPGRVRAARTAEPGIDTELEVLRQLLALPADARYRIVAYLTARRG